MANVKRVLPDGNAWNSPVYEAVGELAFGSAYSQISVMTYRAVHDDVSNPLHDEVHGAVPAENRWDIE